MLPKLGDSSISLESPLYHAEAGAARASLVCASERGGGEDSGVSEIQS
jgi:hypothetical protein